MKNFLKKHKKIICLGLMIFAVLLFTGLNTVNAAITSDNGVTNQDDGNKITGFIAGAIHNIASIQFIGLSQLVLAFAGIMYVALSTIFTGLGMNNSLGFPLIDEIVFNKIAFFDPNFINPPQGSGNSPAEILQSTVSSMYYTLFVIACSVFILAALVIGIKLAVTSIASQKAQYKQAITNWAIGIVMLFTVHFLMAGIFAINEQICQAAYDASKSNDIVFEISPEDLVPAVGKSISKLIDKVAGFFTGNPETHLATKVPGFTGFMVKIILNAISGDIVMSILVCIILGQSAALIFTYIKRLLYCILLGMLAPLVIAIDVIKKSIV